MLRTMRSFVFVALTFNLLIRESYTLPFKRGSRTDEGGKEEEKEEHASVRGAASTISKDEAFSSGNKNEIMESFFDQLNDNMDDESSIQLKEEMNRLANSDHMKEFLVKTRRSLHRHPELMYQESFTSDTIQTALEELQIPFTTGWAKNTHKDAFPGPGGYGVVAHIGSGEEPCIILRADMDALPINEKTQHVDEFRSMTPGKMHACGHDSHITMLLGAAALLKKVEDSIAGTIRLVFQPAEEGGAGGKRMVEEGVVTMDPPAKHAFGMHVWPTLPTGTIASRPGALMAAAEQFELIIDGKGGHAAMPHLAIDPIVAASSLIMNLQTVVSRILSPLEAGVISVTQIKAGHAFNVIPASATVAGTLRSLSLDGLLSLKDRLLNMIDSTVKLHGCLNSTITFSPDLYPPTVNDPELYKSFSKHVGKMVVGDEKKFIDDYEPTMGGEDFSFLALAVPSTFFFLGQNSSTPEILQTDYGLHHPNFALDENVMPLGVELHVNLALRSLKKLRQEANADETKTEL